MIPCLRQLLKTFCGLVFFPWGFCFLFQKWDVYLGNPSRMVWSFVDGITWNPNDPCFDWKRPCFEGFNHQNRGQTGSRYLIIVLIINSYIRKYTIFVPWEKSHGVLSQNIWRKNQLEAKFCWLPPWFFSINLCNLILQILFGMQFLCSFSRSLSVWLEASIRAFSRKLFFLRCSELRRFFKPRISTMVTLPFFNGRNTLFHWAYVTWLLQKKATWN